MCPLSGLHFHHCTIMVNHVSSHGSSIPRGLQLISFKINAQNDLTSSIMIAFMKHTYACVCDVLIQNV